MKITLDGAKLLGYTGADEAPSAEIVTNTARVGPPTPKGGENDARVCLPKDVVNAARVGDPVPKSPMNTARVGIVVPKSPMNTARVGEPKGPKLV